MAERSEYGPSCKSTDSNNEFGPSVLHTPIYRLWVDSILKHAV